MTDALRQVTEVLSGLSWAGTGKAPCTGIWHVEWVPGDTAGATLTVTTASSTVAAALAVPGTNAKTTVASVVVHFAIPVSTGITYALTGAAGSSILGGVGIIQPA